MTYLALDPSLRAYGWAIIRDEKLIDCGCILTSPSNDEQDDIAITTLARELSNIVAEYVPDMVIFENPVGSKSSRANTALAYAKAVTLSVCTTYEFPYKLVTAKQVKKKLTKDSCGSKDSVKLEVSKKFKNFETLTKGWTEKKLFAASDAIAVYLGYIS